MNPHVNRPGDRTASGSAAADGTVTDAAWAECEAAIKRFEDAWRGPARPDLAAFAPPGHPRRGRLLAELAHIDLELRLRAGDDARAEEYLARYPELTAPAVAVELIAAEFAHRRPPAAARDEFLARFPQYRDALAPLLSSPGLTATAGRHPGDVAEPPTVPGHEVEVELGRGGMGVVYRARHGVLNRTVAVKVLRGNAPETRDRFRREAEAMARLDHPHIVPVYEIGEGRGPGGRAVPYFTMKWYPGGGLDARPCGPGTDPAAHAAAVETVARAVHHAHLRGVLHRDLKPSNVLLDAAGGAHVGDFGLAGLFDPLTDPVAGETSTARGPAALAAALAAATPVVLGTPAYMAPEQARDPSRVTTAADVYGLGAVLYHLLAGRPPFAAADALATLELVTSRPPEAVAAANPDVPRDLEAVCLKCLEKDPAARYPSAEALADDLARFRAGKSVTVRGRRWARA